MEICEIEEISEDCDVKSVNEAVKAVLMLDHSKKPFKEADIIGALNNPPHRKAWKPIFNQAKQKLNEMGFTLVNTSSKSYFLRSNIFPLPTMFKYALESETADRTLLVLILTFIFMREGPVSDADILNHLEQLKIYRSEKPVHQYFGDVKRKIFTDFVSQLYLEKIVDKELNVLHIAWGTRAHQEISKRSILEFACSTAYKGTVQPENLVSYYNQVLEDEKPAENSQENN